MGIPTHKLLLYLELRERKELYILYIALRYRYHSLMLYIAYKKGVLLSYLYKILKDS